MTSAAFAPGSVTTVFVPAADPDDGSLGVSFATADGVTASVAEAAEPTVTLDGDPTSFEPVELVLADLDVSARVDLDAEIPVGAGFGASGAATLATALAADEAFDRGRSREELVQAAHRAEVAAGTGLGDVFVQDRGGLVWNTGDGVGRTAREARVEYATHGGIDTAAVLGDEDAMASVANAGRDALAAFDPDAPLTELFDASWTFATAAGLPTEAVGETVDRVAERGGAATMAMVGETVVAAGVDGVLPNATRVASRGARVE